MRTLGHLYDALEALPRDDFEYASVPVVDKLEADAAGLDSVAQIVTFMEDHPAVDFGAPGALSHFIETHYRNGYDEILVASVERRPTPHTLWLLQRLINGEVDGSRLEQLKALYSAAEKQLV